MSEDIKIKEEITVYKGYRMLYDLHTHTTFSHGKGSIQDNVEVAIRRGLVKIAITDHGPGHLTYGIKRSAVPEMRLQIEALKKIYPQIQIGLSVEANIIKSGRCLDIKPEEFELYDFVIGGYHYGVFNGNCIPNYLDRHLPHKKAGKLDSRGLSRLRRRNTEMTVRAIYENNLKILTHPGDKGPFDILAIAKACEEQGTLMEISTWHKHLTVDEIKTAALTDVRFIISSDAHVPERIGDFQGGLDRAIEAGIDLDRIVNIERV